MSDIACYQQSSGMFKIIAGGIVNKTLKKIRQQIISTVVLAFCAGQALAYTIADYRKWPTKFDGGRLIMCAVFLFGALFWTIVVWRQLKELDQPNN
jgi:hypothetical protein